MITNSKTRPQNWDEFLIENNGTYHQSTSNVSYLEPLGFEPIYITSEVNNERSGEMLCFKTTIMHAASLGTPFEKLVGIGKKLAPIIQSMFSPVAKNSTTYEELVAEFAQMCKKVGAAGYVKPHPNNDSPEVFLKNGFTQSPCATFIVDLSKSNDELWAQIESSARRKIKQTQEAGCLAVITTADEDVSKYFDTVTENRKRNGLKPYSKESNWGMWRSFQKSGGQLIAAKKNDEVYGGIMISTFGGFINEWSPSIAQKAMSEKLYVGDLLHWAVIKWGKENNCKYYDLTGVAINPKNQKEQGIHSFKAKWGGKLVQSNEYYIQGTSAIHQVFRGVKKVKNKIAKR